MYIYIDIRQMSELCTQWTFNKCGQPSSITTGVSSWPTQRGHVTKNRPAETQGMRIQISEISDTKNGDRTWQNRPKSQLLWPRHERAAAMAAANRAATNAFAWVGSKNQPRSGHPADKKNFWGTQPSNLTSVVPGSLSVEHWFYLNSRNRMCSSTPGTCPSASGAFMAIHSATNWEAWRCLPMGRAIRRWPGWDP